MTGKLLKKLNLAVHNRSFALGDTNMSRLKNWFKRVFDNKTEDEISSTKSLFKLAPCTFIIAFILGIPLSSRSKSWHLLLFLASVLLRLRLACSDLDSSRLDFAVAQLVYYGLALVTFCFFFKKRTQVVKFISSYPHLAPRLRRIDIVSLISYSMVLILLCYPLSDEGELALVMKAFPMSFLDHSPTLKHILFAMTYSYHLIWIQIAPLCVVMYALGYNVLFEYKWNILASICSSLHPVDYSPLLAKLKSVSDKQKQFESIFSCFLFVSLFYNFLATVFFFLNVIFLISKGKSFYYCYIFFCLFIQIDSIGLVFFVSHYNKRIEAFSSSVSTQLELQLGKNLPVNSSLIIFLQKKIHEYINEPLTACEMVTVDRKIVLTTAASCVSFSVLLIQINNGALAQSS